MAINNPNFIFPVSDPQNNKICPEFNFINLTARYKTQHSTD